MEIFKNVLLIVGMGLLALSVFFTVELERYQKKGKDIPKILNFNWARLWLIYAVIASIILLIF